MSTSLNLIIINILLISLICTVLSKYDYISENLVLKLNEDNLGFAMHEFKYLTLLFYSSTDPNSKI